MFAKEGITITTHFSLPSQQVRAFQRPFWIPSHHQQTNHQLLSSIKRVTSQWQLTVKQRWMQAHCKSHSTSQHWKQQCLITVSIFPAIHFHVYVTKSCFTSDLVISKIVLASHTKACKSHLFPSLGNLAAAAAAALQQTQAQPALTRWKSRMWLESHRLLSLLYFRLSNLCKTIVGSSENPHTAFGHSKL